MQRVRDEVSALKSMSRLNGRLILNYDQVWEMRFRPPKRKIFKTSSAAGQYTDLPGSSDVKLIKKLAAKASTCRNAQCSSFDKCASTTPHSAH